jgi:hypothetical protein
VDTAREITGFISALTVVVALFSFVVWAAPRVNAWLDAREREQDRRDREASEKLLERGDTQ